MPAATKILGLLRHAKSDWDAAAARDIDRPLNARGRDAARRLGGYFKFTTTMWDLVLCSPAVRTRETAMRIESALAAALDPVFDDRLYMASSADLLALIRRLDDAYGSVLIIGHNPGLHDLARALLGATSGDAADDLRGKFPTGGYAEFTLEGPWKRGAAGPAKLRRFITPRGLPA